jgi:hypothetical protein
MSSLIFDTHAAANRYTSAGFTDSQVDALVDVARETTALPDISSLATKADLDRLALATKADFTQLDGKIDRVQAELKTPSRPRKFRPSRSFWPAWRRSPAFCPS